ncbi:MAG: DinB family protein [Candidatus Tectomicrobia bacterium]|uniref:DinB family protein n=1 Tax=Tectimicrobiota bacterium TaxID=2528274 RepID=A0A932I085_UNCTE|nr:DinB family protein [Candidatus Tectomicrobia bacterium]
MNAADLIAKTLELNSQALVSKALDGLTDEDLLKQPGKDSNPTGWLLWHMTRTEDGLIAQLAGKPQVWAGDGWEKRIPLPAGTNDSGFGHTMEQVRAFRAKKQDLLDYAQAVRKNTLALLPSVPPEAFDRKLESPPNPAVQTAGDFMAVLLLDYSHHAGQICYLRGHFKGHGWLGF